MGQHAAATDAGFALADEPLANPVFIMKETS